jgi:hypothetical protein
LPAADFIDTRLPRYHSVFEHPDTAYAENTNQFVIKIRDKASGLDSGPMALIIRPDEAVTAPSNAAGAQVQVPMGSLLAVPLQCPPQATIRRLPLEVAAMKF